MLLIYFLVLSFNASATLKKMEIESKMSLNQWVTQLRSRFKPMPRYVSSNQYLVKAGELLFKSTLLSGSKNISCLSCHNPQLGTSDGLNLSFGQGTPGVPGTPLRGNRSVGRNTLSLINLRQPEVLTFFWDAKVRIVNGTIKSSQTNRSFSKFLEHGDVILSKIPELNGLINNNRRYPNLGDRVKQTFRHGLDIASIVPLISADEMLSHETVRLLGITDPNKEAFKVWNFLVKQVIDNDPAIVNLLLKGFNLRPIEIIEKITPKKWYQPGKNKEPRRKYILPEIHIGHIGVALGEYIGQAFQVTDTPFDRFLRGDNNALTNDQLHGLIVFGSTKANCRVCHAGNPDFGKPVTHLSISLPTSIGVPVISELSRDPLNPNILKYDIDKGRIHRVPKKLLVKDPATGENLIDPDTGNVIEKLETINDVVQTINEKYLFKVPGLRGVARTAPYFHNGSFETLDQVVEHYSHVRESVYNYKFPNPQLWKQRYGPNFQPVLKLDKSGVHNFAINNHELIEEELMANTPGIPLKRGHLSKDEFDFFALNPNSRASKPSGLTENEKRVLTLFLKEGLNSNERF